MASEISRRILFVDDDENLLSGIRRQLRKKFEVSVAVGPALGLEAVKSQGPFAVVVSDFNMPGMSGVEFLQQVNLLAPDSVRVMLTGRGDLDLVIKALHDGKIFRFLNKPCEGPQLESVLADCLEQYSLIMRERFLTAELNQAKERRIDELQDLGTQRDVA